jgi:hypothetical protein
MAKLVFSNGIFEDDVAPVFDIGELTVEDVLKAFIAENGELASEIFSSDGKLHNHLAIFLSGKLLREREKCSDQVEEGSTLTVIKALSGG